MSKEKQKQCVNCGALTYLNNTNPCKRCQGVEFNIVVLEQSHYYDSGWGEEDSG